MTEHNPFMSRIRTALGHSAVQAGGVERCSALFRTTDSVEILERIESRSQESRRELLQQFRENAALLNLNVHAAAGFSAAGEIIAGIIQNSEPEFGSDRQVIQHDHPDIAALALSTRLGDGVVLHTTGTADRDLREKTIASFVGLTAPFWGVADSATVVQITMPGQPRSTSLVPAVHIALLRLENLLADLTELYAVLRRDPPASSYVFISGPSKTADIESKLVHGAHGPREMHAVVVGLER